MEVGVAYLLARLGVIEDRARELIAAERAHNALPDGPLRGLYLSDDAIEAIARAPHRAPVHVHDGARGAQWELKADLAETMGSEIRLRRVAVEFGLSGLDVDLLLVALACDIDPRFEQLYAYLNDDVTRKRPSAGVALALCGEALVSASARGRLVNGPLIESGLLNVHDDERPFPSRALQVPDRVVAFLLGDDAPNSALASITPPVEDAPGPISARALRAVQGSARFVYLRESATTSAQHQAYRVLYEAGFAPLVVDLRRLVEHPERDKLATAVSREARLRGAGVVAGPAEALETAPQLLDRIRPGGWPLVVAGAWHWNPEWSRERPLTVDVPTLTRQDAAAAWHAQLGRHATDLDVDEAVGAHALRPEQIRRAACSAIDHAALDGVPVGIGHLRVAARAENGAVLDRLVRRIEPAVGWADLVLPQDIMEGLRDVERRARLRETVLREWKMRPGGGRGTGITALFAGESGTGKTMSAEVLANALGLDLYVVDLATVVDKYIGETEKNLERIFTAAAGLNGVLLFDEADAIFGKRSEVRDAHDRYANVESAYLLQRIESFDGLAILATNLRANIDDAFTRRLDVIVDFRLPDAVHRERLWDRCLGGHAPRAPDLDLEFFAGAFDLSGGAIRSASVSAAYAAAADGVAISTEHVVAAVEREYRKSDRLFIASARR